jgi:hypothetical protein
LADRIRDLARITVQQVLRDDAFLNRLVVESVAKALGHEVAERERVREADL